MLLALQGPSGAEEPPPTPAPTTVPSGCAADLEAFTRRDAAESRRPKAGSGRGSRLRLYYRDEFSGIPEIVLFAIDGETVYVRCPGPEALDDLHPGELPAGRHVIRAVVYFAGKARGHSDYEVDLRPGRPQTVTLTMRRDDHEHPTVLWTRARPAERARQ